MSKCYVCGSNSYEVILDKCPVPIWINAADNLRPKVTYVCRLNRCLQCGHLYQPVGKELSEIMKGIYTSTHSAVSTSMGKGNWGETRGRMHIDILKDLVDTSAQRYILEIGCDNGYLLRAIQEQGGKDLYGIEPSLKESSTENGITFIKGFVNDQLKIQKRFDFIFSIGVFEHIEDIDGFMRFCKNHISPRGQLYFSVPYTAKYVSEADPGLFIHEHIQYFTVFSAKALLARYGFEIIWTLVKGDIFGVLAVYNGVCHREGERIAAFGKDYALRLDLLLKKVGDFLSEGKVVVHAANSSLNNVLCWLAKDYDFTLVDNDSTKHGKMFFGKKVIPLENVQLTDKYKVLIASNSFRDQIKADYFKRGFKGKILGFMDI